MCAWCFECERDKDESCEILAATLRLSVDEPAYPAEWTFDEVGLPQCSAFVPLGEPLPATRCPATVDMFEAAR